MQQTIKKPDKKSFVLSAVDFDILKLVRQFHFLTTVQLVRLRYSTGSLTTAQERLKRLSEAGYLDRRPLPHLGTGNTEYVYALATKGIQLLKTQGFEGFSRFRPKEFGELAFPHLEHVRSLNDFLIAATLLPRLTPSITLVAMRHDLDLKREPMKVALSPGGKEETVTIIPDGFLDFRLTLSGKSYAMPIWVELDRGSEWSKPFKQKLRAIMTVLRENIYETVFGVSNLTVAFATPSGEKRRDLLRTYVREELARMHATHLTPVFLFAALTPGVLDPQEVFLSPIWYTPNDNTPLPLLDMSE